MLMLDAQGQPQLPNAVKLADYRPPDWLIPDVVLDFRLGAEATRVKSKLSVRRNGKHDRPLVLDGNYLTTLSISIDGVPINIAPAGDSTLSLWMRPSARWAAV